MGVGAGLYMYDVRCRRRKVHIAISSPDEFLSAVTPVGQVSQKFLRTGLWRLL